MSSSRYRINGLIRKKKTLASSSGELVSIDHIHSLTPCRARDGVSNNLEVAGDEVVKVTLENDFVVWGRADDLVREYGRETVARDGGRAFDFDRMVPTRVRIGESKAERGVAGMAVKALEFFGVSLKKGAADKLGVWLEDKLLGAYPPGLYRCSLENDFSLTRIAKTQSIGGSGKPILVFLHGTASSTKGSFGALWDSPDASVTRNELSKIYENRVYALQHRSLTESPIANALAVLKQIKMGSDIHLVSHSRGGMIGELMCLSGCENLAQTVTESMIEELFKTDRTIAEQIGLSPLDVEARNRRDQAYQEDKDRLKELIALIIERKIKVSRFVRVACPARGTTLASGRLDRWFSMLNFLAEKTTGDGIFSDGLDFILGVARERTDPRTMPGLEAMMPGSALTRLIQQPLLETAADLSVIAGDIEGNGVWGSVKLIVVDWFYGADHDLVVNTGSMFGGLPRSSRSARFLMDKGESVNHFSYFRNTRSIDWLFKGLTREDDESGGFQPLDEARHETPRWREAVVRSRDTGTPRPIAIVLPGIMGSTLEADKSLVWLDLIAIARGSLDQLSFGKKGIEAVDLLSDFYGPMLEYLSASHRVEIFPYDWRLSVNAAAEKLSDQLEIYLPAVERTKQPVHIIAHSMGGLVARAMIASARGNKLWQRCLALPNSRFMMLGTPNRGSYEAVRWLTGNNPTQVKLQLLDFSHDMDELIDIVRKFPGLLELLPSDEQSQDFSQHGLWTKLKNDLAAAWETPEAVALRDAHNTWRIIDKSPVDSKNMVYVAGCQNMTVAGYNLFDEDSLLGGKRKRLKFLAVKQGDGTVTWKSGLLSGVPTWFVDNTAHDELCTQRKAFPAYYELLMTGTTTRLSKEPPARLRAVAGEPEEFFVPLLPPTDDIPGPSDLHRFTFGISAPDEPLNDRSPPSVSVSICHGDLAYARHPVLVGHYMGDTIVSAESALDERLDHVLRQSLQLGLYPGYIGTHAVFLAKDPYTRPNGGIVVGLGQVGEISSTLLQTSVRDAMLEYAFEVSRCSDDRFGKSAPRLANVSCLLVGSGGSGISVRESVEAIIRGILDANERLHAAHMSDQVRIEHIQFLEVFEDVALVAADALSQILDGELGDRIVWSSRVLENGQGRLYRLRSVEPAGWWNRLEIVEEKIDGKWMGLRFVATTDRARAEITQAVGQLRLAESFIAEASASATSQTDVAKTLFEMLLPNRLKELAPYSSNLVLLVDEISARYPWELLQDRWSVNGRPPSVASGMLRQLKTHIFRPRPKHIVEQTALVVGDPNLDGWDLFSELPGARNEAQTVAELLNHQGYNVTSRIGADSAQVIAGLHEKGWRVLHLAGHGVHEFPVRDDTQDDDSNEAKRKTRYLSGMVIGKNVFLTPGDVAQMRWTPELVFINCCHLGKTRDKKITNFPALAANLGVEFIKMGVKAVIAAGWAVEDNAASVFARSFYTRMLSGDPFGEAVRAAREEIWDANSDVNTWGSYQCYGDPGFRLKINNQVRSTRRARPYFSSGEIVVDLENLAEKIQVETIRSASDAELLGRHRDNLASVLDRLPGDRRDEWLARADIAAAIGFVWGEVGQFEEAIEWLEKALIAERSDCPLRVIEQLANFKVRNVVAQWRKDCISTPQDLKVRRRNYLKIVDDAITQLIGLTTKFRTEERLMLLGGAYKRRAIFETIKEEQRKALTEAAKCYKEAFEVRKGFRPYAFTNWMTMELLLEQIGCRISFDEAAYMDMMISIESELRKKIEKEPNFWDAASLADIELIRLMISCRPSTSALKPGVKTRSVKTGMRKAVRTSKAPVNPISNSLNEISNTIIMVYHHALERGASPRKNISLVENVDLLIEILSTSNSALVRELQYIRDKILLTSA
jgi:pimeloyl-ACP methyl ester carboxylesterase